MSDLYSPAELIQTVNAEDIQWQINSLFINLFLSESLHLRRGILRLILLTIQTSRWLHFVPLWLVVKYHAMKATNQK